MIVTPNPLLLITTFYLFFLFPSITQAQRTGTLEEVINKITQPYLKKDNTYGLAVGIIHGEAVQQFHYGQLSADNTALPDSNTIFHIGAITKVFTTSILASLVANGTVQYSDTITQYLPDSVAKANPYLRQITLEKLATHASGLPKEPYNIALTLLDKNDPYANYHIEDLYRFLMQFQVEQSTRKRKKKKKKRNKRTTSFKYSHLGISLLGHLLEKATQKSYAELLQTYITEPLAMPNTQLTLVADQQERAAKGHSFNGKISHALSYTALYSAEGLHSTLPDLLKFVQAQMDSSQQMLGKQWQETHQPQLVTNMKYVWVGYGWYIAARGRKHPAMITHSGRTGGYSNFIGFVKETQTAVIVLSNAAERVDQVGIDILEVLNSVE